MARVKENCSSSYQLENIAAANSPYRKFIAVEAYTPYGGELMTGLTSGRKAFNHSTEDQTEGLVEYGH